jgi:hypothetical protein
MMKAEMEPSQKLIEQFVFRYLQSIGGEVNKTNRGWGVKLPADELSRFDRRELELALGPTGGDDQIVDGVIRPGSAFVGGILEDAVGTAPLGRLDIEFDDTPTTLLDKRTTNGVTAEVRSFTPYYDRRAVVVLYHISVETVSQYETRELRATAVDAESLVHLPRLARRFLTVTSSVNGLCEHKKTELKQSEVHSIWSSIEERLVHEVRPVVQRYREQAAEAARVEFSEYREVHEARISQCERELEQLGRRLEELGLNNSESSGETHADRLRTRNDLKSRRQEVETELQRLQSVRQEGFADQRQKVADRHRVSVRINPDSLTEIHYEAGDMELHLHQGSESRYLTVGYGHGVGPIQELRCDHCDIDFTEHNPIGGLEDGILCSACYDEG